VALRSVSLKRLTEGSEIEHETAILSHSNEIRHLELQGRDVAAMNWNSVIGEFRDPCT
jgi:hypothetical protein